jgi:hypothetical protein
MVIFFQTPFSFKGLFLTFCNCDDRAQHFILFVKILSSFEDIHKNAELVFAKYICAIAYGQFWQGRKDLGLPEGV